MQTSSAETLLEAPTESLKGFSGAYRSAGRRARITTILLGIVGFIALLSTIQDGLGFGLIEDARMGLLTAEEANKFDAGTAHLALMTLGAELVTAIAFLAWLSRTVDNIPALRGGRPLVTPRWSIGWWFIPFANLIKPYQIVRDVHDRMAIGASSSGGWIVLAWWLSWVAGRVIAAIAELVPQPINPEAINLDALAKQFSFRGIADSLTLLGALLAIVVVLRIQWRAEARA